VPDARVGVAHNAGGTVASAVVHVLETQPGTESESESVTGVGA
jgi:hypothetical protein